MKILSLSLLFVSSFFTLAGCGSSASTGDSGGGGGTSPTSTSATTTNGSGGGSSTTEACKTVSQARCDRLKTCSNDFRVIERYEDDATCLSRLTTNCEASLAAPSTAQTADNLAQCAKDLATEACSDVLDDNPESACLPPRGTLAAGKACAFAGQCASGFCHVAETVACGTCAATPAAGATCATAADCGYDQACPATTKKCTTFAVKGDACGPGTPCGSGLACVGNKKASMGSCTPAAATVGAACDPTRKKSADCDRDLGLTCDTTTMKCKSITLAAAGSPCGVVAQEAIGCAAGSSCVVIGAATAGTCTKYADDDKPCDSAKGPDCLAPARCVTSGSGTAGTCKLSDGASCN